MQITCLIMIYFIAVDDIQGHPEYVNGEIIEYNNKIEVYNIDFTDGFKDLGLNNNQNLPNQWIEKKYCHFNRE